MTAAIDITAGQRKTLLALFRRFIPGVEVWAYGSRVKWTARPNSDLDLVAFTTPAQRPLVSELKEALGESDLPFLVDFHVWDEVPERFHEIIRKEFVVLQEKKEKVAGVIKPNEWRESTWGEEISLEYGKSLRGYDGASGKYRVFGSNGPIGWTSHPLAPGPGVILGRKGAYRGVQYSREPFYVIDTAYYVVPKSDFDMRWLYYAIQHHKLGEIDDGSPIPSTTRSAVYVQDFQIPPLPEQKSIAHILGTLDDKIELNRRMNATLEAMARALFKSWFVDFDPVRAKLDGRKHAGLDAATAALFPDHFHDLEGSKLPAGWRLAPIEELCAINAWTLGKNDDLKALEYVEISEVSRGNIANIVTYPRGEEPSRARRRLRHGDTVLSTVRPGRGSYFLALNPPDNRVASTGFAVLTPTKAPWAFIHAALTQADVFEHLGQLADGGAYPAVRPEIIGAWKVAVPDQTEILTAFQNSCAPLFEQAEANRKQSRTLVTIRDALLPKLLSGEISITDTENLVEVVL